jgi:hypothetical protein
VAWWRETAVLYTASADADSIVHACMTNGSVNALSLAYECAEVAADLAPALREKMERTLTAAFRDDATPDHRRLVAAVLLSRHLRRFIYTPYGSRLYPQPISTALYWLFRHEAGVPAPDGANAEPATDQPVRGVRRADALMFVDWANQTAGGRGELYRLPTYNELSETAHGDGLTSRTVPATASSAWTMSPASTDVELWFRGERSPHHVRAGEIHRGVWMDVRRTTLFAQLISIYVRTSLVNLAQDMRFHGRRAKDLAQTHGYELARHLDDIEYAHDLGLGSHVRQALALKSIFDVRDRRMNTFPLDRAVAIAHAVDRAKARARAAGLQIMRGSNLAGTLAVDFSRTTERARLRDLVASLHEAHENVEKLAREFAHIAELVKLEGHPQPLNRSGGLATISGFGQADQIAGRRLVQALTLALTQDDESTDPPADIFAAALLSTAAIDEDATFAPDPDHLGATVRACAGQLIMSEFARPWTHAVATRLVEAAQPVFSRQVATTAERATAIRIPALVLAAEAEEHEYSELAAGFRSVVAGITLLMRRTKDNDGEVLLLARA